MKMMKHREKYKNIKQDQTIKRNENFVNFMQEKIGKQKKPVLHLARQLTSKDIPCSQARTEPRTKLINTSKAMLNISYYV